MQDLSLKCWVYDGDSSRTFFVDISTTRPVADLKEAIKKKKSVKFRDVDADDLDLYLFFPSGGGTLNQQLTKWSLVGQTYLETEAKLSALGLTEDIVIIVHVPGSEVKFNCWVYREDVDRTFSVRIPGTETVADLKKAIKKKNPVSFQSVDPDALDLHLFSPSCGDSLDQQLTKWSLVDQTRLETGAKLSGLGLQQDSIIIVNVPSAEVKLNCWVYGEDVDRIFPVKIPGMETVGDLKVAIKQKKPVSFQSVDPDALDLYLLFPSGGDSLDQQLTNWSLVGQKRLDASPAKLSGLGLEEDSVIIVNVPSFNCYVYGEDTANIFPVRVPGSQTIGDLQEAIKKKKGVTFCDVDADALHLYRFSHSDSGIKDQLEHWTFVDQEPLQPEALISGIFVDPPVPGRLHILIKAPSMGAHPDRVFEDRAAYLTNIEAPSSGAKEFSKIQKNEVYLCSRPYDAQDPVSVTLREPIFAEFVDDCQSYQPNSEDNWFAQELACSMSALYRKEAERMKEFKAHFHSYGIGLYATAVPSSSHQTDGHLMVGGKFVVVILEGKNEIGTTSGDPFAQALLYYHNFIRALDADAMKVSQLRSFLPCFHIIVFGPCIGIVGSVFAKKIQSELLVPLIALNWHAERTAMQAMAARTFGALKIAIRKLENKYLNHITDLESPDFHLGCPSWYKYHDADNQPHGFMYEWTQELRDRLIFFGKLNAKPNRRICIKFVERYSADAHRFCSSKGHAPELIAFEKLPGGWYMVVMEALDIAQGLNSRYTNPYRCYSGYRCGGQDLISLENAVTTLITGLHHEGYVHGDLRDANLFIRDGGQDKAEDFMLLDFDWAGKLGETYYPAGINTEAVHRPSGITDGMVILKEHDMQMLRYLFHPGADIPRITRDIGLVAIREGSDDEKHS